MRKSIMIIVAVLAVAITIPAFAELQNVQVGGSIKIRGNYWSSAASPDSLTARNPLLQPTGLNPADLLRNRIRVLLGRAPNAVGIVPNRRLLAEILDPDGNWVANPRPGLNPLRNLRWNKQVGRFAISSPVDWNDEGPKTAFVEQRTRLNVKADFTDMVSAYIELDNYDVWGEAGDFRSNYINGVDTRAATVNDVEVYQAYIEANEMFGAPLRLRIGRQEIKLGSGWLVGTNNAGAFPTGLSFDGIRATYATDQFSVDAIWAKLAENGTVEEDGDVDMYALYGSYLGIEDITIDAYGILVRDARTLRDTNSGIVGEWWEDVLNVDDYDVTNLYTIGLRGAGTIGAIDFEAELAYQFGNMDAANRTFAGGGLISPYGPDNDEMSQWAGNLQVGYTLDMTYTPRPFVGGAYFGGEDQRDVNFWDWLGARRCPYWSADSSLSFNRLFSDWQYSNFVDTAFQDCSNLWLVYGGVSAMPTEDLTLTLSVAYVQSLEDYMQPWGTRWTLFDRVRNLHVTRLFAWSWADEKTDDDLCFDVSLKAVYNYSEDLSFEAGYSHMFVGDGAADGNFNINNGLGFEGGTSDDDADYVYFETKLCF